MSIIILFEKKIPLPKYVSRFITKFTFDVNNVIRRFAWDFEVGRVRV